MIRNLLTAACRHGRKPAGGAGVDWGLWRAYAQPRDGKVEVIVDRVVWYPNVTCAGACEVCGCDRQRYQGELFCTAGCDRRTIPEREINGVWHPETYLPRVDCLNRDVLGRFDVDEHDQIAGALTTGRERAAQRTGAEADRHAFYRTVRALAGTWAADAPVPGSYGARRDDGGPEFWLTLLLPVQHDHERWWPRPARVAICRGQHHPHRHDVNDPGCEPQIIQALELTITADPRTDADITADRAVIDFLTDQCRQLNDRRKRQVLAVQRGQEAFAAEELADLAGTARAFNHA